MVRPTARHIKRRSRGKPAKAMNPSRFRFTLSELLLLTALCGLVMGMVTASRREVGRWYPERLYFSPAGRFLVADYFGERVRLWNVQSSNPRTVELGLKNEGRSYLQVLGFADSDTLVGRHLDESEGRVTSQLLLWNVLEDRLERSHAIDFSPSSDACLGSTGESVVVIAPWGSGRWTFGNCRTDENVARFPRRRQEHGRIARACQATPWLSAQVSQAAVNRTRRWNCAICRRCSE